MIKQKFHLKIKLGHQPIVDSNYNDFEELDETVKFLKRKFEGGK